MPEDELRKRLRVASYSGGGAGWTPAGGDGIQDKEISLWCAHAYVRRHTEEGRRKQGSWRHVERLADKPILIGTWAMRRGPSSSIGGTDSRRPVTATRSACSGHTGRSPREQIETSVVLADGRWRRPNSELRRAVDPPAEILGSISAVIRRIVCYATHYIIEHRRTHWKGSWAMHPTSSTPWIKLEMPSSRSRLSLLRFWSRYAVRWRCRRAVRYCQAKGGPPDRTHADFAVPQRPWSSPSTSRAITQHR